MRAIVAIAIGLILCGCSSPESVAKLRGHGSKRSFNDSYDRVWDAVLVACQSQRLDLRRTDKAAGFISAVKPVRMESWGENVAIWVTRTSPSQCQVEVISRHGGPTLLYSFDWEAPILQTAADCLAMRKN